jgi:hypothetical protein
MAFCYCASLSSAIIPDSVSSIECMAFYGCSSLTLVTIPECIASLPDKTFEGCSSLSEIRYKGTKEQWDAIEFEEGWDKDTGDYTVIFEK